MMSPVLVVEDDPILRWLMTEAIEHLGYEVIQCANADEALEKVEGDEELSMVITDVRMPGSMDGIDLAQRIWWSIPSLPVILVSGHTVPPAGFLPYNARFIKKPCRLDQLNRSITELLTE